LDGGEFAALDLVQHGLAGDAERLGGRVECHEPSGTAGTNRARISSARRIRQGAWAVVCSPGSRPARSQRWIVLWVTPSSAAACSIVNRSLAGSGGGAAGIWLR
jgi:hypothetical protein